MEKIVAITIGVVAVIGAGIGFASDYSSAETSGGKKGKRRKRQ